MKPLLETHLSHTKSAGRLAFGLYLVPGYPSWSDSQAAVEVAFENGVDFIEFPILGTGRFTNRTGSSIAKALGAVGTDLTRPNWAMRKWLDAIQVGVGVVYEGAWPRPDLWCADSEFLAHASALLTEANVEDVDAFREAAANWNKPLIVTVDASAPAFSLEKRKLVEGSRGFIYVSLGDKTGQRSAGELQISRAIEQIRATGSQTPVFAAFGLRDVQDIEEIRRSGCDGAIIGTAAIEVLEQGQRPFRHWLKSIIAAC